MVVGVGPLATVVLLLAVFSVISSAVLIARRLTLARAARKFAEREDRLTPLALGVVHGEPLTEQLSDRDADVLAQIIGRYARQLSGDTRIRIAAYFDSSGHLDRQLKALHRRQSWRRATAAYSLGAIGGERAVGGLLSALDDPSREVRAVATNSLGGLHAAEATRGLVALLNRSGVPRTVASRALLLIGPEAVTELRPLASATEPEMRATAIELIGLTGGPDECPLLRTGLGDPAPEVRICAIQALGRLGGEQEAAELQLLLLDSEPAIRTAAATALGMLRESASIDALIEQAQTDQFEPAQAAASALMQIEPNVISAGAATPGASAHMLEASDLIALRRAA